MARQAAGAQCSLGYRGLCLQVQQGVKLQSGEETWPTIFKGQQLSSGSHPSCDSELSLLSLLLHCQTLKEAHKLDFGHWGAREALENDIKKLHLSKAGSKDHKVFAQLSEKGQAALLELPQLPREVPLNPHAPRAAQLEQYLVLLASVEQHFQGSQVLAFRCGEQPS